MAKTFRATFRVRLFNTIITFLIRSGVKIGPMSLLTVRGRKSGQPRTTPVAIIEGDGQRWLSSPYGEVDWVKNLRKAGEATLTRARRTERVSAAEVSTREAALVLQRTLPNMPSFLLAYYDVAPDASLADIEREALRHPVFRLEGLAQREEGRASLSNEKAVLS